MVSLFDQALSSGGPSQGFKKSRIFANFVKTEQIPLQPLQTGYYISNEPLCSILLKRFILNRTSFRIQDVLPAASSLDAFRADCSFREPAVNEHCTDARPSQRLACFLRLPRKEREFPESFYRKMTWSSYNII